MDIQYEENEEFKSANVQFKLKKLKEKLSKVEKERTEYLQGWQKERADFINYKKSQEQGISDIQFFIQANFIKKLLPVIDNIERAKQTMPAELKENQWAIGIEHISTDLSKFLKELNIETFGAVGEQFNPLYHEAVAQDGEGNIIIEVFQQGYKIGEKVIRHARVKVGGVVPQNTAQ